MIAITIEINGSLFSAQLYDTDTTRELIALFPLTMVMEDLHGNEKFHYLDKELTINSESIGIINSGDLMLYGTSCLVVFYDTFKTSFSYTKLGYIENFEEVQKSLGNNNVQITFKN